LPASNRLFSFSAPIIPGKQLQGIMFFPAGSVFFLFAISVLWRLAASAGHLSHDRQRRQDEEKRS
jgi:hypothetical protein